MGFSKGLIGVLAVVTMLLVGGEVYALDRGVARDEPASSANYSVRSSRTIDRIVIHSVEGSLQSCIGWFRNPGAQASAHYVVGYNGEVVRMVDEKNIAWHAGNWNMNERSIGIEHEGWAGQNLFTDEEYRASARLARAICDQYGIPIDRNHILGHGEFPNANGHWDPGPHWDWDRYIRYIEEAGQAPVTTPPPPTTTPDPIGSTAPGTLLLGGDDADVFRFSEEDPLGWLDGDAEAADLAAGDGDGEVAFGEEGDEVAFGEEETAEGSAGLVIEEPAPQAPTRRLGLFARLVAKVKEVVQTVKQRIDEDRARHAEVMKEYHEKEAKRWEHLSGGGASGGGGGGGAW